MSWTSPKKSVGEKLGNGIHNAEIYKIFYERKDGTRFMSQKGDPQINIQFRDTSAKTASKFYTLSDAAEGFFIDLCEFLGMDLEALERDKVHISEFADEAMCEKNLIGRRLKIKVMNDHKEYPDVEPYGPADPVDENDKPQEEDIPF